MLNIYEEYASQEDRENDVMLENASIAMHRAILAANMCLEMEKLNFREADTKVVMEGGDMDTLLEYYEEATEKTEETKKGLFATVWAKITAMFRKIGNVLTGKRDIDPNKEYDVPEEDYKEMGLIDKIIDNLKKFMSSGPGKILAIVGVSGALMLLWKQTRKGKKEEGKEGENGEKKSGKTIKVLGSKLIGWNKKLKEGTDTAADATESCENKKMNDEEKKETQGCLSKIAEWFKSKAKALMSWVGNKAKKKAAENGSDSNDSKTNDTDGDANQQNDQNGNNQNGGNNGSNENDVEEESVAGDMFDDDDFFAEDASGIDEIAGLLATI